MNCVVLATRPLLMCLLREKLESNARGDNPNRDMASPVRALLKTLRDSANRSLHILGILESQDLIGRPDKMTMQRFITSDSTATD